MLANFDVLSGDAEEENDSQRNKHRQINKILPFEGAESREKTSSNRRYLQEQSKAMGHRHCLVFDFGLILKHYDTFYSGLIFSVVSNSGSEMKRKA